jgi:hypothetical protein
MAEGQHIAYISDIGARSLKPLFVTGACSTAIFLDLSLISERWLRHHGRLIANLTRMELILAVLSLSFAGMGTVGLICLSVLDALQHESQHNVCLLLFITGYMISAVFTCWEYQRLRIRTAFSLPSS